MNSKWINQYLAVCWWCDYTAAEPNNFEPFCCVGFELGRFGRFLRFNETFRDNFLQSAFVGMRNRCTGNLWFVQNRAILVHVFWCHAKGITRTKSTHTLHYCKCAYQRESWQAMSNTTLPCNCFVKDSSLTVFFFNPWFFVTRAWQRKFVDTSEQRIDLR